MAWVSSSLMAWVRWPGCRRPRSPPLLVFRSAWLQFAGAAGHPDGLGVAISDGLGVACAQGLELTGQGDSLSKDVFVQVQ